VRRQGPCHSRAAIDTRRQEALQSASTGVRSIPFSVAYKGTSTERGIRGFNAPGDVRAPITVCEQRIEVGGERGIRSLGHPLDSVSYTNHIAGNARNASIAVGPCPFLPPEGGEANDAISCSRSRGSDTTARLAPVPDVQRRRDVRVALAEAQAQLPVALQKECSVAKPGQVCSCCGAGGCCRCARWGFGRRGSRYGSRRLGALTGPRHNVAASPIFWRWSGDDFEAQLCWQAQLIRARGGFNWAIPSQTPGTAPRS